MTIMNFIRKTLGLKMELKDEKDLFVEKYCRGKGIEIGGAAHQCFHINAKNVDIREHISNDDVYRQEQLKICGQVKKVDIIARGDKLPLNDSSVDFVFSSHVIEHFYNPMSAIREWIRVVKNGGYIVMLVPNKLYTFDKDRECTTINEFEQRDLDFDESKEYDDKHHSVWTLETFLNFANHFNLNIIDYIDCPTGMDNSFGIAIKIIK